MSQSSQQKRQNEAERVTFASWLAYLSEQKLEKRMNKTACCFRARALERQCFTSWSARVKVEDDDRV